MSKSPIRELGPLVWLTSMNQIAMASDASLRRSLETCDGQGVVFKKSVLDEIIRRAREDGKDNE